MVFPDSLLIDSLQLHVLFVMGGVGDMSHTAFKVHFSLCKVNREHFKHQQKVCGTLGLVFMTVSLEFGHSDVNPDQLHSVIRSSAREMQRHGW